MTLDVPDMASARSAESRLSAERCARRHGGLDAPCVPDVSSDDPRGHHRVPHMRAAFVISPRGSLPKHLGDGRLWEALPAMTNSHVCERCHVRRAELLIVGEVEGRAVRVCRLCRRPRIDPFALGARGE